MRRILGLASCVFLLLEPCGQSLRADSPRPQLGFQEISAEQAAPAGTKVLKGPRAGAPSGGGPEKLPRPQAQGSLTLKTLWALTLAQHPELEEAAATIREARGRAFQASRRLNPTFIYQGEGIGSKAAGEGEVMLQLQQEIQVPGKRRLDIRVAERGADAATQALMERRYELATRLRRAYTDYLHQVRSAAIARETDDLLAERIRQARNLVDKAKVLSRAELLTLEVLYEEIRLNRFRIEQDAADAMARLLAAIGYGLDRPADGIAEEIGPPPDWDRADLERLVVSVNSRLLRAQVQANGARLALERARLEAIPNPTVVGGYKWTPGGQDSGSVIYFQWPLPVLDRKQGWIRQAESVLARAQAAIRSSENQLLAETRAAWARYEAQRRQAERLEKETLPRQKQRRDLIQQAFRAGVGDVNFNDLFLAERDLFLFRIAQQQALMEMWRAIADLQGLIQEEP